MERSAGRVSGTHKFSNNDEAASKRPYPFLVSIKTNGNLFLRVTRSVEINIFYLKHLENKQYLHRKKLARRISVAL